MRKILISIIIVLLIIMAYFVIFKGLTLGNFKILSANQIVNENDKLTEKITTTETLINSTYPDVNEKLNSSVSQLLKAENEYLDLANVSTKAELLKASTVETYTVEFLWTVLGRHSTAKGVNLNYTPKNNNTIEFTVAGDYVPILEFVTAIENDSRLGFTIENFKLIQSFGSTLQATFITRNVTVKSETTQAPATQSTTNENTQVTTNEQAKNTAQ